MKACIHCGSKLHKSDWCPYIQTSRAGEFKTEKEAT